MPAFAVYLLQRLWVGRQLQERLAITAVYVTHDQDEAMAISDRIAVMNGGTIIRVDTTPELGAEPALETYLEGALARARRR